MANPVVLQDDFSAGMKRDFPQDQMPPGSLWEVQDMLPNRVGTGTDEGEYRTLETRGGWNWRADDPSQPLRGIAYFAGAAKTIWHADNGGIISTPLTSTVDTFEGGTNGNPAVQHPVEFYDADDEWLVVFPSVTPNPYRLRKTLPGSLTNMVSTDSAPAAYYGDVWKQRMWFGHTTANPARVYFSAGGDVGSWNTAEDYVDTDETVDGLAALRTVLLVFHPTKTTRFRGSPPDLIVEEAFRIAPFDMFSWTRSATETIVLASPEGLFLTDGSATKDLTKASGMSTWWRERMQEAKDDAAAPSCPIGHANGWIVINLKWSTKNFSFAINLETGSWFRLTNCDFTTLFSAPGVAAAGLAGDEIWATYSSGGVDRGVGVYPDIFSTAQQDADGTEPTPLIETPFFSGKGPIEATARALYFTYNLGGATEVTGTYKTNPRMQHTEYSLPMNLAVSSAADELKRRRVRIAQRDALANGVAVRLTKTASAGNFALHSVEAEIKAREGSRVHYFGG